ncbi:MAG: DUF1294 domain-containing protein [Bacteroidales bacterium]|nr:DUF1294 domain-containing protein [Bacteroidales bacterium]
MSDLQRYIFIFLLITNVATFITYGIDKWKSKKSKRRIRETSLFVLALIGGSVGALLGMKVWNHKTSQKKFKYGIPAILIIQLIILGYFLIN